MLRDGAGKLLYLPRVEPREVLREVLFREINEGLDTTSEITDGELLERIDFVVERAGREKQLSNKEKGYYRKVLFASFRQLDILSVIMDDPEVTEIMVNGPEKIFIEKHGKIQLYDGRFSSPERLNDVIQQIASAINRRINEATPYVDARLQNGSRVNMVIPPISLDGPSVTIRLFPEEPISMEDLVSFGSLTGEAAAFLRILVRARYNLFVSGGTGTGKTTFLGALAEFIPETERVITIEDSAELRLRNVKNLVRLESRSANLEGEYEVTIRDLIKCSLRMRPERIVVGEVRGREAFDMLSAYNTGHDGSLSTGHANSAEDMLTRIETMVLMGMELPLQAIRAQIASGIEILVHLSRLANGKRVVQGIYEIVGMREQSIEIQALFERRIVEKTEKRDRSCGYEKESGGNQWELVRTEHNLSRTQKLLAAGYRLQDL